MKIATDLAGFTMGKADALRKAMGKKKMDILAKMFVEFEAGMVANGFSKEKRLLPGRSTRSASSSLAASQVKMKCPPALRMRKALGMTGARSPT